MSDVMKFEQLRLDVALLDSDQKMTHTILCDLVENESERIANAVADAMGPVLSRLDSLESKNTSLKARLDSLESENTSLKAKVAELESSAATVPVRVQTAATINVVEAVKTDTASTPAASTDAASTPAASTDAASTPAASTDVASTPTASTPVSTPKTGVIPLPPPPPAIMPSQEKVMEAVQDLPVGQRDFFIMLAECLRQVMNRPLAPLPPPPPPLGKTPAKTPAKSSAKSPVTETTTVASGSGDMSWLRNALPNGMVGFNSPCSGDDGAIKDTGKKDEIKSQPENQSPGMGVSGVSKDALAQKMEAQKKKRDEEIKRLDLDEKATPQQVVEAQRCEKWCKQAGIPFMKTKAELKTFFELHPEVNDFRIQEQVDRWGNMTEEDRAKEEHQRQMIHIAQRKEDERRQEQAENGDGADVNAFDD